MLETTSSLPLMLSAAFGLGLFARAVGLPPLVGFLAAGFALSAFEIPADPALEDIAQIGVTLLLFSIGLKLKLKSLAQPEIWAGTPIHMALILLTVTPLLAALGALGLGGVDLTGAAIVAFALSFSSTVFAIKVLEERGEMASVHGRVAIGVLIIQDLIAVAFLTASTGKVPSVWALGLVGLLAIRPLLSLLLDRIGHGELLPLFGLFAAVVLGASTFELVGMKPDLGALVLGMLMAHHERASEVADSLLNFKEIFLVGFFLSIGLAGVPTLAQIAAAMGLMLLLPLKAALFFVILTRFGLRARSAFLAAASLATYSEFGLIVGAVSAQAGWLGPEWLTILALALSVSFLIAARAETLAHGLYARFHTQLRRFETAERREEDQPLDIGAARILVFGMGRVGAAAYDRLRARYGDALLGVEIDPDRVARHRAVGRRVILGDATDSDFWERAGSAHGPAASSVKAVLLAMPEHAANLHALEEIKAEEFDGFVAAIAHWPDEADALRAGGADVAFNLYAEAGLGFADHIEDELSLALEAPTRAPRADAASAETSPSAG